MSPPICIVGAGPIGTTLAVLCSHQRQTYLLIKEKQREKYIDLVPEITGELELKASPALSVVTPFELERVPNGTEFWICTRAYDARDVAELVSPRLKDGGSLVLTSNGLGLFMDLAVDLGRSVPIVRALFSFGVKSNSLLSAELTGKLIATVSSMPEHSSYADSTIKLLNKLNFSVKKEKSVAIAEWRKVITNIVINSLCTIADVPNGELQSDPELRLKASQMLSEIREVAKADGFDFSELTDEVFFDSISAHAGNINSTLAAVREDRKTETYYFVGRFLKIAESYGIPVPITKQVESQLKLIEGV